MVPTRSEQEIRSITALLALFGFILGFLLTLVGFKYPSSGAALFHKHHAINHVGLNYRFKVHLDIVENWKLKLKTEKYCSKIIFKYVNSTVKSIFNEKINKK